MTEGIAADGKGDKYAPPPGIEAGAVALGLSPMAPSLWNIRAMKVLGRQDIQVPAGGLSGNLAGGKASGALVQFTPKAGSDGHFVVFDVPEAGDMAAQFCLDAVMTPAGKLTR
jgi:hypothetical protein